MFSAVNVVIEILAMSLLSLLLSTICILLIHYLLKNAQLFSAFAE